MSDSKLISIVYINVCIIWEYARNAIESTIIFMMNYFFTDCKKYFNLNAIEEYKTSIKPLRKLYTHHLSYNCTFSVPVIITISHYLFLKVSIQCPIFITLVCVKDLESILYLKCHEDLFYFLFTMNT